jgi:2-keto-4-pentenoate hydratase/2-oxohepta-3-ene-1,7-dioic acid hydratase in catechol pathway
LSIIAPLKKRAFDRQISICFLVLTIKIEIVEKMKFVTFYYADSIAAGIIDGDDIIVCSQGDDARTAVLKLCGQDQVVIDRWVANGTTRIPLAGAELLSPIPHPQRDILCVGKNYYAHAAEFHSSGFDSTSKESVPEVPVIFTKAPTSVVGPGALVNGSLDPTQSVDYEIELGIVIGKKAFQVSKAEAYDHVFGYLIINDVTSRELQQRHGQWIIGKSLDTFCPMGPWLVTSDEITDVNAMKLVTKINGEVRQQAVVSDLIFDIPTLIETMTATMTLMPGDIIATGTPAGVGIGFTPPKYLSKGDHMSLEISGLGRLENTIE